jgi:ubiquinone/menaquinone biosynthesis C-methylase UbiE
MSLGSNFIDRTARRPYGKTAVKSYNNPKAHYPSFRIILDKLKLTSEDRYLEIGCGGGVLLRQALETAASAGAIDHSEDMVKLTSDNNRQALEGGRLEVVLGDVAQLPWVDCSFTAGASANMFFFVEQPQVALREACRVLKPGGRFAMTTIADGLLGKLTFGWLFSLRTYSNQVMTDMLNDAGFSYVEVQSRFGFSQICYAVK